MRSAIPVAVIGFAIWFVTKQVNAAITRLDPDQVRLMIERVNRDDFDGWFDPLDVLAVIQIESAFDPDARRYEPALDDASMGLMQVLYSTARDRGFAQGPAALFDPLTNIRMGMRQLKWSWDYLARHLGQRPTKELWVGSYNSGVGNILKGRVPQGYVRKWQHARRALG